MPVTVAVVGCGAVTQMLYVPTLTALAAEDAVRVVAVVDPNPVLAARVARSLGCDAVFASITDMLTVVEPELSVVAVPHRLHREVTVTLLQHASHVLCEKPMAITSADCDAMIAAAEQAGRLVAIGHFRRFFRSCGLIKQFLDEGVLGRPVSFRFYEGETYSWPVESAAIFRRSEAGGGVLIDVGVHMLDLLLWWMGDVAELEYADDAMGGVEASCLLRATMANGARGTVQLSRDWPLPNRCIIECEKGWVTYVSDVVDAFEWGLSGSDVGVASSIRQLDSRTPDAWRGLHGAAPDFMACFVSQMRNVLGAIAGTETLLVPGTDARRAVALIERCYRERRLLPAPWLEQRETDRAQELAHGV